MIKLNNTKNAIMDSDDGVIRVSPGIASTFADVYHLTLFLQRFVDQPAAKFHPA